MSKIKPFIFLFISITLFTGCSISANYEDKDMTKLFIEKNKEKLKKIYDIKVEYRPITLTSGRIETDYNKNFTDYLISNWDNQWNCDYIMHIDSNSLEFHDQDVVKHGKPYLFKEAQKCLDAVIEAIEKQEAYEKASAKKYKERINEKFDPSKIEQIENK